MMNNGYTTHNFINKAYDASVLLSDILHVLGIENHDEEIKSIQKDLDHKMQELKYES